MAMESGKWSDYNLNCSRSEQLGQRGQDTVKKSLFEIEEIFKTSNKITKKIKLNRI